MCCLFGLIDTELRFTGKEKSKMFHALASASEARGTDATGVAYDYSRTLHIYKRPIPGHKLNFYLRNDTRFAMGHTRMTTQGLGYSGRAFFSGVTEMFARTIVSLCFVGMFGYTAICFADQTAWLCACLYIAPTCFYCVKKVTSHTQYDLQ